MIFSVCIPLSFSVRCQRVYLSALHQGVLALQVCCMRVYVV